MTGTHNVYAIELDRKVLKHKKVLSLNPKAKSYLPPLYIGMSGLRPEDRFVKHKEGIKANSFVQKYGLKLRPEFGLSNLSFSEAEAKEEQLAKKMRAKGYPILGGNPQLPSRQIKKAGDSLDVENLNPANKIFGVSGFLPPTKEFNNIAAPNNTLLVSAHGGGPPGNFKLHQDTSAITPRFGLSWGAKSTDFNSIAKQLGPNTNNINNMLVSACNADGGCTPGMLQKYFPNLTNVSQIPPGYVGFGRVDPCTGLPTGLANRTGCSPRETPDLNHFYLDDSLTGSPLVNYIRNGTNWLYKGFTGTTNKPLFGLYKKSDWTEYDRKRAAGELPEQQARVVKRIQERDTPGLVLFHGMGSGKTRASIESYKALGMPADIIVPAALQENYRKESRKWLGKVPDNMNIVSQQRLANPTLKTKLFDSGLQVVDEAQKAKDKNSELYQMLAKTHPKKRLLLSGTPMLNNPAELGNLVNLAANKQVLPDNARDFKQQYFKQQEVKPGLLGRLTGVKPGLEYKLQHKKQLSSILDKYVDYYKPTQEGYPTVEEQEVSVPMGAKQQELYDSILGKAGWWARYKVKHNLPPGRGELESMRAFLSGPRQVSNSTSGFTTKARDVESPKVDAAFKFLQTQLKQDPSYKALVYSNYLNNGIKPYEKLLEKNHIPYGEFSGDVPAKLREQAVRDYNDNKLKALLVSGAGAEGLDLKATRLEQLLEPHWNLAKERQVIGRGARFHSHDSLPPEKRKVLVQRYFAEPKANWMDRLTFNSKPTGTDAYIHNLAKQKDMINQEIVDLVAKDKPSNSWLPSYD
jgi:hypothetical protein